MASASASSCFRYITFVCALLFVYAFHRSTGANFQVAFSNPPPPEQEPSLGPPGLDPSDIDPSATPTLAPSPAPAWEVAPSPSPSWYPSPTPSSVLTQGKQPESLRRRAARILGLVLVSFVGMLQAFVVLFLCVKRQQMLKHMYVPRARRDPLHMWTNA